MAKLSAVILTHHTSSKVKIRIAHNGAKAFIDTGITATKKDISKGELRQSFVAENLSGLLKSYNDALLEMRPQLPYLSAADIKERLLDRSVQEKRDTSIDFIKYFSDFVDGVKASGRPNGTFRTSYNALVGYVGNGLLATDITSKFLSNYELHLNSVSKGKGVSVHNIMRELRTVFNSAIRDFNDEDQGIILIPNNPYRKYKLPKLKLTESRALDLQKIAAVKSAKVPLDTRTELARDLAMLSFYLCGMNAADLYEGAQIVNGRVEYNRSKTKGKRRDNAFISIKLVERAEPLWNKYIASGVLKQRYSTIGGLNTAIKKGMDGLREITNIPFLQFYSFRHSFATIARNDCRISKDDIAMALNHVDSSNSVTDIYIRKDWKIIDDVQKAVIDALEIADLL